MLNGYPRSYWESRIAKYSSNDWAKSISPFAVLFDEYINDNSSILELGAGAGQDSIGLALHGHRVTATDGTDCYFKKTEAQATNLGITLNTSLLDLYSTFPFDDESFDAVFAQLVLHYFDDNQMTKIINEISRVLKPGGFLGIMVNSTNDPEYKESEPIADEGMRLVGGLVKRYFSVSSLKPFVDAFEPTIFNDRGRTPKDDAVGVGSMVQFIGRRSE